MFFQNQTFEYLTQEIPSPWLADFEALEYGTDKYKTIANSSEYWRLLLNELGAVGWELISIETEPQTENGYTYKKCVFKRSSRSRFFNTGIGTSLRQVQDFAEEEAKVKHFNWKL